MVHAALLLLMLEAANADLVFTISLKRSTPNLLLSTNSPADYPIFGSLATELRYPSHVRFTPDSDRTADITKKVWIVLDRTIGVRVRFSRAPNLLLSYLDAESFDKSAI